MIVMVRRLAQTLALSAAVTLPVSGYGACLQVGGNSVVFVKLCKLAVRV
jgi:hypothetical protein